MKINRRSAFINTSFFMKFKIPSLLKATLIALAFTLCSHISFGQSDAATLKPSPELTKSKKEAKKEAKAEERIHEKSKKDMDKQISEYHKKHYKKDFKHKHVKTPKGEEANKGKEKGKNEKKGQGL